MAVSHNCHRLLSTGAGYLEAIRVSEADLAKLREAREAIRQTLRGGFKDFRKFVEARDIFGQNLSEAALANEKLPTPKFRIQGSFDYHTANTCQQTPPQQIDQDDGVYLPTSFVSQDGKASARVASSGFFTLIEKALQPLCAQKGWRLNPNGPKSTCVRVEVSSRLHIDLPLYAIKDSEFNRLMEKSAAAGSFVALAMDEAELATDVFNAIPDADILLAHRRDGWIESDPRKLGRWFEGVVEFYGPQIRRLARAYKGLRDAAWTDAGPGSIAIMAVMVAARERVGALDDNRDDVALLRVGREMVKLFESPIHNPAFPGEPDKCLCKDWTPAFRGQVISVFDRACDDLEAAIDASATKSEAYGRVVAAFGPWVPNDLDLILGSGSAAAIRATRPEQQPRPVAPRTKSG